MENLRRDLGTKEFGWVAVREHGHTGQDLHYHALVTGLTDWHAPERLKWIQCWNKIGGDAQVDVYRRGKGGIQYILKDADPNDPDALEIEIQQTLFPDRPPARRAGEKASAK
jgi:hypothetical protein